MPLPALCGNGVVNPGETCDPAPPTAPHSTRCAGGGNDELACMTDSECSPGVCWNPADNDACPADCVIDACTVNAAQTTQFDLMFDGHGSIVASLTVLLDFPEGKANLNFVPGTNPGMFPPSPFFPVLGPLGSPQRHAFRIGGAQVGGIPGSTGETRLARFTFRECVGQPLPNACELRCVVVDATDPQSNPLQNVSCRIVPV
jgi:hypothetical protein